MESLEVTSSDTARVDATQRNAVGSADRILMLAEGYFSFTEDF